jgi:hypothetical protein
VENSVDRRWLTPGAEILFASEHPIRLAGRRGLVVKIEPAEIVLVDFGPDVGFEWLPISALAPAYGGEL